MDCENYDDFQLLHELCHDLVGDVQTLVRQAQDAPLHLDKTFQSGQNHWIINVEEILPEGLLEIPDVEACSLSQSSKYVNTHLIPRGVLFHILRLHRRKSLFDVVQVFKNG